MPKYVIERALPGAGTLSPTQLQEVAKKSCDVLRQMGQGVQWQHSYITGDKVYCIYIADTEKQIREHARLGGFPADRVSVVTGIIDPATAE